MTAVTVIMRAAGCMTLILRNYYEVTFDLIWTEYNSRCIIEYLYCTSTLHYRRFTCTHCTGYTYVHTSTYSVLIIEYSR